jgi:hypothetical protein
VHPDGEAGPVLIVREKKDNVRPPDRGGIGEGGEENEGKEGESFMVTSE